MTAFKVHNFSLTSYISSHYGSDVQSDLRNKGGRPNEITFGPPQFLEEDYHLWSVS